MTTLRVLAALGVNNICSDLPSARFDQQWSVDALSRLREHVERFGITLDMVPLPLSSHEIATFENPNIMLGKSPERDREIDKICQMIRNAARAGIPALKYNMTLLGVVRTGTRPARGGARYSTFVYDKAGADGPAVRGWPRGRGHVLGAHRLFSRARDSGGGGAQGSHGLPSAGPGHAAGRGYRGVETVLGSVDGLKRFVEHQASPYHGLNFCQGTVAEMLEKPGEEIFDVIRYFGSRRKIFNVHFRNIRGGFLEFRRRSSTTATWTC